MFSELLCDPSLYNFHKESPYIAIVRILIITPWNVVMVRLEQAVLTYSLVHLWAWNHVSAWITNKGKSLQEVNNHKW